MAAPASLLERLSARFGPALLAVTFALMARWTWGTWADVLIDFGRELYVPWQLNEGAVLYRDVAWFNGPLSAHANAALFGLFGASLRTLVLANLALLALLVGLLWTLLRSVADAFSATLACLVLLTVFAFGHLVGIANYNFVCPYSHEVTHGVLLAVGCLWALRRWELARRTRWLALAGLCLGLCFLTKAEVFLAALAGAGAVLALTLRAPAGADARARRDLSLFLAAGLAPVALAFLALAVELPAGAALRGTLGSWPSVIGGGAQELAFYRQGMGLDAPLARLGELAAWSGRWALVFVPAAGLAYLSRRAGSGTATALVLAPPVAAGLVLALGSDLRWLDAGRPLPLVLALLVAGCAWRVARTRERRFELGLCLFALVLLAKMALNARVIHYGFALAMPATLLVVVALAGWGPAWIDARGRAGDVLRLVVLAVFGVAAYEHVELTGVQVARKTFEVGRGPDRFLADVRGRFLATALEDFERLAPPGSTLAALPEGVMVNWLVRSRNPTPYVTCMPPELLLFGEDAIVRAFAQAPPDYVMLIHKDTSEYGYPLFGPDYGRALAEWVQGNYEPVRTYGEPPLQPGTVFGILLLQRR